MPGCVRPRGHRASATAGELCVPQRADAAACRCAGGGPGAVAGRAAVLPVYSTVTGDRHSGTPVDAAYFGRNVRDTVRFAEAIGAMVRDGYTAFVEIGAHPVLAANIAECAAEGSVSVHVLASMRRERPQREAMLQACAGLYAAGRAPDWVAVQGAHAQVLDLPAYPWQHERFWLKRRRSPGADAWSAAATASASTPALLGTRLPVAGSAVFQAARPDAAPSWLADHRLGGRLLMPAMGMLEVLRQAAVKVTDRDDLVVEDFVVHRPMALDETDGATTVWQVVAAVRDEQRIELSMHCRDPGAPQGWQVVASARAVSGVAKLSPARRLVVQSELEGDAVYAAFDGLGVAFGSAFRTIERLSVGSGGASATLRLLPGAAAEAGCHPVLLDGALQACVAALDGGRPAAVYLPVGVGRYALLLPAPERLHAEVTVERIADGASVAASVRLLDDGGRCVAMLDDVRFAPAPSGIPSTSADEWLHETSWVPDETAPAALAAAGDGAWVVVAIGAAAQRLAQDTMRELGSSGRICRQLGADAPAHAALADANWREGRRLAGVALMVSDPGTDELLGWTAPVLAWAQALARSASGASLHLVTIGAQGAGAAVPRPGPAAIWGLGSAIAAEHPELALRMIDLDPDASDVDARQIAGELLRGQGGAARLAWRAGLRLVPRLRRRLPLPASAPLRKLVAGRAGTLEELGWQPLALTPPAAGEVRLRVLAAGLNFRDVLMALGMIPDQLGFMGAECAGVVEAVGEGVNDLSPGDTVFGLAPGSLASVVNVPAGFVARWPDRLGTIETAASLPAAFLTAMLGLHDIAGLRAGQTVLIHAAAGGVGWAAMQLALRAGATVLATAGSPEKREMLRALGAAQVFDSRSLAFAEGVRAATGGRGADVVLNSLAGDFIAASVEALAADGCFLELGKRELWSAERFRAAKPSARYEIYDLGSIARAEPGRVRPMLNALIGALEVGQLTPPPLRVFGFDEAAQAMRLMAQARHVGKLVLRAPRAADTQARPAMRADASYLVTGGLGALGLHAARWLAGLGARHLVLTGRHPPGNEARPVIEDLTRKG
ncbi:zinc-binding dehydrogenase [Piscinibacter aquaticus]|uniref:Zinc-binding dehydrogenase n=1 Tax=Piscinibacter aquaticus TaxID=392597 RepID=A0A5C6U2V2_9BURK|nr:zinc-binding dehydrogenase [Piscinibacter aquaticus]